MPSAIEWTDETWNPVTGCTRVSPGCDNCYMFALYPRLRAMAVKGYETAPDQVRLMPERLRAPLLWKKPRYVFVNSMSDVFHPQVPFDFVYEMFSVMRGGRARKRPCIPGTYQETRTSRRVVGKVQAALSGGLASQRMDRHISRKPEVCAEADRVVTPPGADTLCVSRASA